MITNIPIKEIKGNRKLNKLKTELNSKSDKYIRNTDIKDIIRYRDKIIMIFLFFNI